MDYDTIYQIIKEAFTNVEHSHGNEQDLVIQLRNRLKYVSRLADWKIRI